MHCVADLLHNPAVSVYQSHCHWRRPLESNRCMHMKDHISLLAIFLYSIIHILYLFSYNSVNIRQFPMKSLHRKGYKF